MYFDLQPACTTRLANNPHPTNAEHLRRNRLLAVEQAVDVGHAVVGRLERLVCLTPPKELCTIAKEVACLSEEARGGYECEGSGMPG